MNSAWMILWTILLVGGFVGLVGLLLIITVGAFKELGESLSELEDAQQSTTDSFTD